MKNHLRNSTNKTDKFYKKGLCFECKRCSNCCRHSGFVFLSEKDIEKLSCALNLARDEFMRKFCKTIAGNGEIRVSLIERANADCIFYNDEVKGCSVYKYRPLQCKLYPFWERMLIDENEWRSAKQYCPGIDCGRYYSAEEIEQLLNIRHKEPLIK